MNLLPDKPSSVVLDFIDLHDAVRDSVEKHFNVEFKRARCKVYASHEDYPQHIFKVMHAKDMNVFDLQQTDMDPAHPLIDVETVDVTLEEFVSIQAHPADNVSWRMGHNYDNGISIVALSEKDFKCMEKHLNDDLSGEMEKNHLLAAISHYFMQEVWDVNKTVITSMVKQDNGNPTTFSYHGYTFDLRDLPLKILRWVDRQIAKGYLSVDKLMRGCARELNPMDAHLL